MKNLTVVLGTAREGRESEKVARTVYDACVNRGIVDVTYVDVRDQVTFSATTRVTDGGLENYAWKDIAYKSDGFIFIIPEYNHGYPGEWKLLMDSLKKDAYMKKVAGIVGVSSGAFGGLRAAELATLSLSTRGMYVLKDCFYVREVQKQFDENGQFHDTEEKDMMNKFIDTVIQETET